MKPKLSEQAKGKWPGILSALGVSRDFLTGKHGPCPICKDGKDRFRFDNKDDRGTYYCSQCGSGDGIEFVKRFLGVEFKEAAREIEKHVGGAPLIKVRQGPDPEEVKAEINRIWTNALPLTVVDEAADWWRWRVGFVPVTKDLRASPALKCPGAGMYAAMLALIRGADGKPVNMHRTFLGPDGRKAQVDEPRRVMALPMPKGCAVRLASYGAELGIAEGIETAIAATALFGTPCWSALNAVTMEGWEPPEGPRIVVFADNDANFAGQAAAYQLAKRLRAKKIEVEVRLPPAPGMDWNDVWMARDKQAPITAAQEAA